ncbi:hypothetical protein [Novosphingobium sp. 18052]|nr:hypothetical protein [Novosphingobium sp. 18052]
MGVTHTPGPFAVEEPLDGELWIVEAGKDAWDWRVVASLPFPSSTGDISRAQVKANAALFSGAPEMLTALEGLSGILATAESNASGNPEWEFVSGKINAARTAIARAKGTQA